MAASRRNLTKGSEEVAELKVSRLRIGSRLLQDAYSGDGSLLLRAGAPVDSELRLERLLQPDVRFGPDRLAEIPVDLENEAELDAAQGTIDPRVEKFLKNINLAKSVKYEAIEDIKELFRRVNASGEIDLDIAKKDCFPAAKLPRKKSTRPCFAKPTQGCGQGYICTLC